MCGIFGIIEGGSCSEAAFQTKTERFHAAIESRGPDGSRSERLDSFGRKVVLGHARLAIIDLSDHGAQPMHDPESGWWLIYNGEIYNYPELRQELQAIGWSFSSASDSEVLLKAWTQWGIGALERLNGMFAFCAFNKNTGELWLVRDRFGVKPLLWGERPDGGLVFSSSVACVAEATSASVDPDYCSRALHYRVCETPGSEAPFKEVNAVSAGSWIKFQLHGTCEITRTDGRWYNLYDAVSQKAEHLASSSDEELLNECRYLLEDSVTLRLRSDVPVAVSLSGGVDSSAVAAIASQHIDGLRGFTYGSPEAPESEGPVVEMFANEASLSCDYIWPRNSKSDLISMFERVLKVQEAPFGGLSTFAQHQVFQRVNEAGFKVMLGGQGGDEAFAGYRKFFLVAARDAFRNGAMMDKLNIILSLGRMLAAEVSQARGYWQARGRYANQAASSFQLFNWSAKPLSLLGPDGTTLCQRQGMDILQFSLPTLLRLEDRNSMAYGIESRLPFMDYRLIELALALPTRLKISRGYGKWALRQVVNGLVPNMIRLDRKKRGFDVNQKWVTSGLGDYMREQILDNQQLLDEFVRPDIDLAKALNTKTLAEDGNLLDEAIMLAWLVKPVRL